LLDAAEMQQGATPRFQGSHATAEIFVYGQFEMGGHLRVKLTIHRSAAEEGEEPLSRLAHSVDHRGHN